MGRLGFGPLGMQVAILYAYIWSYMYSCKAAVLSAPGPFGSSHELTSEEVGGGMQLSSKPMHIHHLVYRKKERAAYEQKIQGEHFCPACS